MATFAFSTTNLPITPVGKLCFCPDMSNSPVLMLVDTAKHGTNQFYIYTSTDGVNWVLNEPQFSGMNALGSPGYINNRHVVLGSGTNAYLTSWTSLSTGQAWTPTLTTVTSNGVGASSTTFDGTRLHSFPNFQISQNMANTFDGVSWSATNTMSSAVYALGASNQAGISIFANSSSVSNTASILRYVNGAYELVARPGTAGSGGLAYDGDMFMILDLLGNKCYVSSTGAFGTWVQRTLPVSASPGGGANGQIPNTSWRCLLAVANTFIALNGTNTIYASDDNGLTWTSHAVPIPVHSGTVWQGKVYMWNGSPNPTIVVGTPSGLPKRVTFNVDEAHVHTAQMSRFRRWYMSIVETLTNTFGLSRNQKLSTQVNEQEQLSIAPKIERGMRFSVQNQYTYTGALSRLRKASLSVLENEVLSFSFNTRALKELVLSINESSSLEVMLTRARPVVLQVSQTEVLNSVLARARSALFSVQELETIFMELGQSGKVFGMSITMTEALDFIINRVRSTGADVTELYELQEALSVLRSLQTALEEAYAITFNLRGKVEFEAQIQEAEEIQGSINVLRDFIVSLEDQLEYNIMLSRLRSSEMTVNQVYSLDAALNRLRLQEIAIAESHELVFNFGRTRALIQDIFEQETMEVALERFRNLQSDIQEVFKYDLEIQRIGDSSDFLYLTISWQKLVELPTTEPDDLAARFETVSDTLKLKMRHELVSKLIAEPSLVTSIRVRE